MAALVVLESAYRVAGTVMSRHDLADKVGLSPAYVHTLLRIHDRAPEQAQRWFEEKHVIPIREMTRVALAADPAERARLFERLVKACAKSRYPQDEHTGGYELGARKRGQ